MQRPLLPFSKKTETNKIQCICCEIQQLVTTEIITKWNSHQNAKNIETHPCPCGTCSKDREVGHWAWSILAACGWFWDCKMSLYIRQCFGPGCGRFFVDNRRINALTEGRLTAPLTHKQWVYTTMLLNMTSLTSAILFKSWEQSCGRWGALWKICQSNSWAVRSVSVKEPLDVTYTVFWQEAGDVHRSQHKIWVVRFSTWCWHFRPMNRNHTVSNLHRLSVGVIRVEVKWKGNRAIWTDQPDYIPSHVIPYLHHTLGNTLFYLLLIEVFDLYWFMKRYSVHTKLFIPSFFLFTFTQSQGNSSWLLTLIDFYNFSHST